MKYKPLLLVVDDETAILQTLKEVLEEEQFRVNTLSDGSKALDMIGSLVPDLVLLDIFMPHCNGLELLAKIKKEYPDQKVIIISGFGTISIAIEAIKKGALDFIEKPLNLDDILSKIEFLKIEKNKPVKNDSTPEDLEGYRQYGIVGESYLFLELMRHLRLIANLNFPVLIYGQHGVGKTLSAEFIYKKSSLNKDEFFTVDCASGEKKIPSFLKQPCTILFKNINDLNETEQKKILDLLEVCEGKNIRVIATASVPLFGLVQNGSFNSTLFHKLNVVPVEIPILNKRRYDIPLLAQYFLVRANEKYGKSVVFNNKSIRLLRNHRWISNVTGLKNFVERVVASAQSEYKLIDSVELAEYLNEKEIPFVEEQQFLQFRSFKEATEEFERNFLLYMIRKNRYDLSQVSDKLQLNLPQLQDRLLSLNIELKG